MSFLKINFDIAEIYLWPWFEQSGQRLENFDRTNLELASGKRVLQKSIVWRQKINSLPFFPGPASSEDRHRARVRDEGLAES